MLVLLGVVGTSSMTSSSGGTTTTTACSSPKPLVLLRGGNAARQPVHEAAETGLPLGTIKSRIRLALDRLRHAMS